MAKSRSKHAPVSFYDQRRKHYSLDKQTPDTVYFNGMAQQPDHTSEIVSKKAA